MSGNDKRTSLQNCITVECFTTHVLGFERARISVTKLQIMLKPGDKNNFEKWLGVINALDYCSKSRHGTQHNDAQHNDTMHNDTMHNDTMHNDTMHNDTMHNDTLHNDT